YYIVLFNAYDGTNNYYFTGCSKTISIEAAQKVAEHFLNSYFGSGTTVKTMNTETNMPYNKYWNKSHDKWIKIDKITEYSTLDDKTLSAANVIPLEYFMLIDK
ncbi:MAG: hypothetical protein QXZ59_06175, partial [Nitrososphaeria archaeon]